MPTNIHTNTQQIHTHEHLQYVGNNSNAPGKKTYYIQIEQYLVVYSTRAQNLCIE